MLSGMSPGLTIKMSHYLCIIFEDGQAKAIALCAKIALPQKLVTRYKH